jgi:hypothetical protein
MTEAPTTLVGASVATNVEQLVTATLFRRSWVVTQCIALRGRSCEVALAKGTRAPGLNVRRRSTAVATVLALLVDSHVRSVASSAESALKLQTAT